MPRVGDGGLDVHLGGPGRRVRAATWKRRCIGARLADATTLCLVLTKFAHVRHHRNEVEEALRLASEALAVARPLADCVELGDALNLRAHVHARCGERDRHSRSLSRPWSSQAHEQSTGMFSVHLNLAFLAIDAGSPDEAKPHLDEALALMPCGLAKRRHPLHRPHRAVGSARAVTKIGVAGSSVR